MLQGRSIIQWNCSGWAQELTQLWGGGCTPAALLTRPILLAEGLTRCAVVKNLTPTPSTEALLSTYKQAGVGVGVGESPGSPVVRTPHYQCQGHGFDPWLRN